MTPEFYKVLHIVGILMLFSGLSALLGVSLAGTVPARRMQTNLAILHGVGLMLILISGFGMLARLGLMSAIPGWAIAKMVIWLALGGSMVLAKRKAAWGLPLLGLWIALGGLNAYFALYKPF